MIKTKNGPIIKRSSKYGVGKQMGNTIYIHKSSRNVLPGDVIDRPRNLYH